jgi:hypothetical protein
MLMQPLLLLHTAATATATAAEPQWEVVSAALEPVIGADLANPHGILQGFETGNFMKAGGTYYYSATELGFCKGIRWDSTTRAGLWSAPNSTGPWTRLVTLRNSSSMYTVCKDPAAKNDKNSVAWATTLVFAPSGANGSKAVWNLFNHGGEAGRFQPGDGIVHAVSTTDSIEGPYVELSGTAVPGKDVVVPNSHAFAAWKLRNGSWAGFRCGRKTRTRVLMGKRRVRPLARTVSGQTRRRLTESGCFLGTIQEQCARSEELQCRHDLRHW